MTQLTLNGKSLLPEVWVNLCGYEGLYQISNLQRLKSFHKGKEKILKPYINKRTGRALFLLHKNGKGKWIFRARLMAMTFIPNIGNLRTVNHINGKKLDDRIENLEWLSLDDNIRHGYKTGLYKNVNGSQHFKPVIQMDLKGKEIASYPSIKEAARVTGATPACISMVARNVPYKWVNAKGEKISSQLTQAGGYKWKFADSKA